MRVHIAETQNLASLWWVKSFAPSEDAGTGILPVPHYTAASRRYTFIEFHPTLEWFQQEGSHCLYTKASGNLAGPVFLLAILFVYGF
ncbi:MAG: hypothetical protein WD038_05465 [Balneolales bacterium]